MTVAEGLCLRVRINLNEGLLLESVDSQDHSHCSALSALSFFSP